MAFGKDKSSDDPQDPTGPAATEDDDELDGPFDIDDFDDPSVAALARLDLGSVSIPMPEAGQVQVELTDTGVPSAVWVVTRTRRFTIAATPHPRPRACGGRSPPSWPTRCAKTSPRSRSRTARGAEEVVGLAADQGQGAGVGAVHRGRRLSLDDPLRRQRALV